MSVSIFEALPLPVSLRPAREEGRPGLMRFSPQDPRQASGRGLWSLSPPRVPSALLRHSPCPGLGHRFPPLPAEAHLPTWAPSPMKAARVKRESGHAYCTPTSTPLSPWTDSADRLSEESPLTGVQGPRSLTPCPQSLRMHLLLCVSVSLRP